MLLWFVNETGDGDGGLYRATSARGAGGGRGCAGSTGGCGGGGSGNGTCGSGNRIHGLWHALRSNTRAPHRLRFAIGIANATGHSHITGSTEFIQGHEHIKIGRIVVAFEWSILAVGSKGVS